MRKLILLLLALGGFAFGARTTVTDTLYTPTGGKCSGSMYISYPSFYNASSQLISAGTVQIRVTAGVFTVALEPGNYYTVTYQTVPSGCNPTREYWNVPVSVTPVNLATVRTLNAPVVPPMIALASLAQTSATNGQCIVWSSGMGVWAPGACAAAAGITSLNGQTGSTQTFANDTNVTISSAGNIHTLGWTGTLAAARLNANVVQSIVNDTNVTGSIAAQALTLGWTGTLAAARLVNAGVHTGDAAGTFPAVTLNTVNGNVGTFGNSTNVAQITVNAKGLITAASNVAISGGAIGDVTGPGSATDNAVARFDGTTGKIIQNSAVTIADTTGDITTPGTITTGSGGSVAGAVDLGQGTAPAVPANSFGWGAPTTMTTSQRLVSPNSASSAHSLMVIGAPTANVSTWAYKVVPDCQDTTGNHLNFTQSTDAFSCGTSVPSNVSLIVASGAKALDTDAIASTACDSMTATATGALSTDVLIPTFSADVTGVTGYAPVVSGGLQITWWLTADTVNIKVCNPTSSSITPGAVTINWIVIRRP